MSVAFVDEKTATNLGYFQNCKWACFTCVIICETRFTLEKIVVDGMLNGILQVGLVTTKYSGP